MAKQKRGRYFPLSEEGLAKTGAILGFLGWLVGLAWHGMMGQPSIVTTLYGLPYINATMQSVFLVAFVAGGFVLGWLVAAVYNRVIGVR